jgi:hypothetical protein
LVIAYINGYHGRNSKVYDRRLTLHRGVNNPITFTFKNEDQKAQDIEDREFELNLIDSESKKSVLTRNLTNYNTVQATGAQLLSDGSSSGTTARMTITNSNITGTFVVKQQVIGTSLTGPVTITNIDADASGGTETVLTVSFGEQTIPSETVNITAGAKGTASITITEGDLLPLDAKFYNFAVREVKTDGSKEVTYSDTGYASAGTVELLDGAYPEFVASTEVSSFTAIADIKSLAKLSSEIHARPGINNNKALHTIAVYTKNFSGAFKVQGTMSTAANKNEDDWFNIIMDGEPSATNTFTNSTAVTTFNFTGVFQYVRFTWDNDAGNTGLIDKILYRQ